MLTERMYSRLVSWVIISRGSVMNRIGTMLSRVGARRLPRAAFTLVELLVVIGIVGALIAIAVPAIQRVRSSANVTQCANNLRQIGLAFHNHHTAHKSFPSGGWGWSWIGTPGRSGSRQTGGWVYSILPYIEQSNLRKLGFGENGAQLEKSVLKLLETPVPVFACPARRTGGPYPADGRPFRLGTSDGKTVQVRPTILTRGDYAANVGSQAFNEIDAGPASLMEGDDPNYTWPGTSKCTGIVFPRSSISSSQITRGTSNVIAAGERYLNPEHYLDGLDWGDNEAMYAGFDNDTCRVTYFPPKQDRNGKQELTRFGSAHSGGMNVLYCDGSVRLVSYGIEPSVFSASGRRFE
jgi:prepilin-type processing-associated H-X9-DG protein/prepilin-type N-terminal cleavage/methylation domain-containing protein